MGQSASGGHLGPSSASATEWYVPDYQLSLPEYTRLISFQVGSHSSGPVGTQPENGHRQLTLTK